MQRTQAIQALREVGEQLARTGVTEPVVVILGGAVAGMIQGALPPSRWPMMALNWPFAGGARNRLMRPWP